MSIVYKHFRKYVFAFLLALGAMPFVYAQSGENPLNANSEEAEDTRTSAEDSTKKEPAGEFFIAGSVFSGFANYATKIGGKTTTNIGTSTGFNASIGYAFHSKCPYQNSVAAGIEVLAYTYTHKDTSVNGAVAYDNVRYWYAGIPITLQTERTKPIYYGNGVLKAKYGYYMQLAGTLAFRVSAYNQYAHEDEVTTVNLNNRYKKVLFQPSLGFGMVYKTSKLNLMGGPYIAYTGSNLLAVDNAKEHALSVGLRLSILFTK
ncbi:MAG: hypothetical protein EBX41_01210 [Chitinophagia bacterium]|nr:hypothetical protein [Chitinophagia bacterium]